MKYARIENGLVREIIDTGAGNMNEMFHADIIAQCVECDDAIAEGMTHDGAAFGPVPANVPTWEEIRTQRNTLLCDSDWTQLSDAQVNVAQWAAYRQTLRDLPQVHAQAANVNWPVQP